MASFHTGFVASVAVSRLGDQRLFITRGIRERRFPPPADTVHGATLYLSLMGNVCAELSSVEKRTVKYATI
jgi:hypothetical protein